MKKTYLFSNPYHLHLRYKQMVIEDKASKIEMTRPIDEMGLVILDDKQITLSAGLLVELAQQNVALVLCNEKRMPEAMMLPLHHHHTMGQKFQTQIAASEPLKKSLWQQIIKAKILNQAAVVGKIGKSPAALEALAKKVLTGDTTNVEGNAARVFFGELYGKEYRRDPDGANPNPLQNYAYSLLRAAMARALIGSGLQPIVGLWHSNKYNGYPLADDMMEPYRPMADMLVWQMLHNGYDAAELAKEHKQELIGLLFIDTSHKKQTSPLQVTIDRVTANLAQCLEGKAKKLDFPTVK